MITNTLPGKVLTLGGFLRDRRARVSPDVGSGSPSRRRTPGLRREEVATRAGVSVTWYTWLEQGRGGPPSDDVLERLARALGLDAAGREVLFLLAQQRPPPVEPSAPPPVPPALQRVLDALPTSPAYVKTPTWDIVAWNAAAAAVLGDYAAVPSRERNVLRRVFNDPATRIKIVDWEANARFILAAFRVDVMRAGEAQAALLVAELESSSADFRRLWAENEVGIHGVGQKRIQHPIAGCLTLEYSAFSVDGAEGLDMVVFTPVSPADAAAIAALLSRAPAGVEASPG